MPRKKVALTGDIAPGKVKLITVSDLKLAICNVDGKFFAVEDRCTHDGGALDQGELIGDQIECPRHGARFRVTDGRVMRLPAVVPIKTYAISVEGDEIYVEVP